MICPTSQLEEYEHFAKIVGIYYIFKDVVFASKQKFMSGWLVSNIHTYYILGTEKMAAIICISYIFLILYQCPKDTTYKSHSLLA